MTKKINQMSVRYRSLADGADAALKCESSLDKILSHGNYTVEIDHTATQAGLPVEYCGSKHYIVGTLVVTDCGTMQSAQDNRVMGQVLIITLRDERETKIFTRTLASGEWSPWRTMAQTGMYDKIANDDELYATVTSLVSTTKETEESLRSSIINYNEWKATNAELSLPNVLADAELVKLVKSGTILTFKNTSTTWKRFQYTAASTAAANVKNYSNWKELSAATYSIKQAVDANKVQISTTGENGGVKDILNISAATTERAGVMSAEDKKNLNDNIVAIATEVARAQAAEVAAIEQGRQLALRDLYIAAGALYNNSGVDIPRIAPWGDSVIHKAGHYYLNGLGDITEEEMTNIYNCRDVIFNLDCSRIAQQQSVRTIYPVRGKNGVITQVLERRKLQGICSFYDCKNLEVLYFTSGTKGLDSIGLDLLPATGSLLSTFTNSSALKIISGINCSEVTSFVEVFDGCSSLVEVRLYRVCRSVSFNSSPNISKGSLLYIIKNSQPTSAITITLHPDAYARFIDDADIEEALALQPLVVLVSV